MTVRLTATGEYYSHAQELRDRARNARPWMGEANPSTDKAKRAQRCQCEKPVSLTDDLGSRCGLCGKAFKR